MVWVRRLDRQTALNDLVFEVGKLIAEEGKDGAGERLPELSKDVKLFGGAESIYLFMQWRRNDFNPIETWGEAYASLPYWLLNDLATLNNRIAWGEVNAVLDLPPAKRDEPPLQ